MSEALTLDPGYSFKRPPEWNTLVAATETAIIPRLPYRDQRAAVDALWEVLPDVDLEAQEDNRYYGLGLIVCKVAKSSFLPADAPGSLISGATDTLVRNHHARRGYYADGLRLKDIVGTNMVSPITDANLTTYAELSLAQRLVANTLHVLNVTSTTWEKHDKDYCRNRILNDDRAFRDIKKDTFVAAATVWRTAAEKLIRRKATTGAIGDVMLDAEWANLSSLHELLTDEEVRTVCPASTAAQASQLRLDELARLSDFIYLDDNNVAQFNKAAMPEKPTPGSSAIRPAHKKRIKCPALYVAGAIPHVANALPDVVLRADHRIRNQE